MYPVSEQTKVALFNHAFQRVDISYTQSGVTKHITNDDIITGGLVIDRYSCSGTKLELGTTIASQMTLRLYNTDGRFNNTSFAGKELYVVLTVNNETIPVGYYTVDVAPRKQAVITIEALDRMTKFDKPFDPSGISFPTRPIDLLLYACTKCGVPTNILAGTFLNSTISVTPELDSNTTYRTILQYIGELSGNCLYIDYAGRLKMGWYSTEADEDTPLISKSRRYTSDIYETTSEITTLKIEYNKKTIQIGSSDYKYVISNNKVLTDQFDNTIATYIRNRVYIEYTPFTASCLPMPYMYPMDCVRLEKGNETIETTITNVRWTLNGKTELKAKGETNTQGQLAQVNPITSGAQKYIDNAKADLEEEDETLALFNRTVSNGLGLYRIEYNGTWYFSNAETLEDATLIYTILPNNRFAYAKGQGCWNDGDPDWTDEIDTVGNLVANTITADMINALDIIARKIEVKNNANETMFLADADNKVVNMAGWQVTKNYIGSQTGSPLSGNNRAMFLYAVTNTNQKNFIECQDSDGTPLFMVGKDGTMYAVNGYFKGTITADETGSIGSCTFSNGNVSANKISCKSAVINGVTLNKQSGSSVQQTVYFGHSAASLAIEIDSGGVIFATTNVYSNSARTTLTPCPFDTTVTVTVRDADNNTYSVSVDIKEGETSGQGYRDKIGNIRGPLTVTANPSPASQSGTVEPVSGLRIDSNFLPAGQYNLGASDKRWNYIYSNHDVNVSSDRRLKKDINYDLKDYEGVIDDLKPVSYRFLDGERQYLGFIAQDVKDALGKKDVIVHQGENGMYSMAYAELHALEVMEIQKLKQEIKELKDCIKELKEGANG